MKNASVACDGNRLRTTTSGPIPYTTIGRFELVGTTSLDRDYEVMLHIDRFIICSAYFLFHSNILDTKKVIRVKHSVTTLGQNILDVRGTSFQREMINTIPLSCNLTMMINKSISQYYK